MVVTVILATLISVSVRSVVASLIFSEILPIVSFGICMEVQIRVLVHIFYLDRTYLH